MIRWRLATAGGRTSMLTCVGCGAVAVNETNGLRRAGWQESIGQRRVFRCGQCSYLAGGGPLFDDVPDDADAEPTRAQIESADRPIELLNRCTPRSHHAPMIGR